MRENLLKFLKVFLFVTLAVLAALLAVGIVLAMQWPWWVAIFLLLFIAGMALGVFFIRRLIKRNREKKFVSDMVAQDEAQASALPARERDERKQLQSNWKAAIEILHKSHLKKMGNPLYVLPWYLIIGESGSGKTTSLNSARLASPFPELGKTAGISGTRNCDWWFLDQAIIIDTAGRYAVPVNGDPDTQEWRTFLSLLVKYRKKEPLNGLIVAIAADKLLGAGSDGIEEEARIIRRRVDELMRVLGVKFPVYVLVTKCDLIQGVNRFCEKLSDESLRQPMGIINQTLSTDAPAFVESALQAVGKRLRNLRMLLLHSTENKNLNPPLMFFPEEFDDIRKNLSIFTETLFSQNPYQETPVFRGLFFSSGRQEGNPHSHFSRNLGMQAGIENLPGTARGLFLHDFFAKILPKDRRLLTPTRKAMEWTAVTNNLGLTAWVVVWIALCGLMSFSFVKNLHTIGGISREFQKAPVLRGEFLSDMITMDHFRKSIMRVEEQNRGWWIPRFGLRESMQVEKGLKEHYCKQFADSFMHPFDRKLIETVKTLPATVSDDEYVQYMSHLVRRINILGVALENPNLNTLRKKPQPTHIMLDRDHQNLDLESKKSFGNLYLHYLVWKPGAADIQKEIDMLHDSLERLYAMRGQNMMWLVAMVGQHSAIAPVTLNDFWGGTQQGPAERRIPPAFTSRGKQAMDAFARELEEAYPKAPQMGRSKLEFDVKYRALCMDAWRSFAEGFAGGANHLRDLSQWQRAASRMAADGGPYFSFIDRATLELAPMFTEEQPPAWLLQLAQFQRLRTQSIVQETGYAGKVAESGKKMLTSMEKMLGRDVRSENMELQLSAAQGCSLYKTSLAAISPATTSKNLAYQFAAQVFGEEAATSKSPFYTGYRALERIKRGLGAGECDSMAFRLISGPLDFLWHFVRKETSGYLEDQWNEQILAPTVGMSSQQMMPLLVGPDGLVWKFVKTTAAPFLARNANGYCAREALGGKIPLDDTLYQFLNKGARAQATAQTKQPNYNVGIKGIPTEANAGAKCQPHGTRLELQCGSSSQMLINNNFPVGKTFYWSPDTCGDVILQIEVGDLILSKRYLGPQAFPEFLRDFKTGQRTFIPREFPGEKSLLEKLGVKLIKVSYQFIGTAPVLKTIETMPAQLPRSIGR